MGRTYGASHQGYTAGCYDSKHSEVYFTYWEDGRREVDAFKFDWYFYLTRKDALRVVDRTFFNRMVNDVEDCGELFKIYMPYYGDERRDLIQWMDEIAVIDPLEADVDPVTRFVSDNEVKISLQPRLLFFDMETDARAGFDNISKHRILSISYGHNPDDIECLVANSDTDAGEEELLDAFLDQVSKHDAIVSWNGEEYDDKVLKARTKKLNLRVDWQMINFVDHMQVFQRYFQRDEEGKGVRVSYSLENISQTCLGEGKVELGIPKRRMIDVWREHREKLIEYNNVDVLRMCQLEDKYKYIESLTVMAQVCNRFLSNRALGAGHLIDGFVLRYGTKNGHRFGTKIENYKPPEKIPGAWVMEPLPGLHEGVCDLDFSALYPSVIRAFNISPEVRNKDYELPEIDDPRYDLANPNIAIASNGAVFQTDKEGLFPAIVTETGGNREQYKKKAAALEKEGKENTHEHRMNYQRSVAWKQLTNALCLGTMASPHSRYYDRESGEAITSSAKFIELSVVKLAEDSGLPSIYGDTDSGFIRCKKQIGIEFIPRAEKHVDELLERRGAKKGLIRLKLDAYFLRLIFTGKKHYAGKKDTGVWDIRGLKIIRSDGCRYTRELERRILELLLEAKSPSPQVAEKIVRKWADKLFSGTLPVKDLVVAQGLAKPLGAYAKPLPVHAKVAKDMMERGLEVYQGMKIPYIFTGRKDGKLTAVHVDDYEGEYDPVHYWNRVFPETKSLLESAWPRQQAVWDALESYNPNAPQKELFDPIQSSGVPSVVVFKLKESDRNLLTDIRRALDEFPGSHPVVLCLQLDSGAELNLKTECKVRLRPELIKQLESVVSHRVHYDKEDWDGQGQG